MRTGVGTLMKTCGGPLKSPSTPRSPTSTTQMSFTVSYVYFFSVVVTEMKATFEHKI